MADLNAFEKNQESSVEVTGKTMRIGIIGCGGIANSHAKAYKNMPDAEIVACCDIIEGRAAEFAERHGFTKAKTNYKDHTDMLEDKSLKLDAVSICTYNRQHVPCAMAALNAGVHVLLEKPLCVTMEEAVELYKAVKKTGLVFSVGFQPRFDQNMQDICDIVQSGELGKVYYIQTGGGRRIGIPIGNEMSFIRNDTAGIGALADIGCYSLDMVLRAVGYPKPLTVSGYKSDFFGKDPEYFHSNENKNEIAAAFSVDDFGAGFIRLEGGIVLDFRISWAMHMDTPGDTLILGTKGGLRIPSTNCWNGSIGGPMTIYKTVAGKEVQTKIPMAEKDPNGPTLWDKKIRTFLDACKNGTGAPVPIDQIIYNQAIIDGIVRSAELGEEIKLDFSEIENI